MRWRKCKDCDHVFAEGHFTDEAAAQIFSAVQDHQEVGYHCEDARPVCGRMVESVPVKSGKWLDVGFGAGGLMFAAQEAGFQVCGVDIREQNVAAMKDLGIEAACCDVRQVDGSFDVVSLCDVLEHMPDPVSVLEHVRKIGRFMLVSCPSAGSVAWHALTATGQNPYWREIEHYHNFTRARLYDLLRECGWEPQSFRVSDRYRLGMEIVCG
jgi:2-polyprenyl-3-methyl-5-hydroxy-6-metoxy-1,4-benzoquinol methylase